MVKYSENQKVRIKIREMSTHQPSQLFPSDQLQETVLVQYAYIHFCHMSLGESANTINSVHQSHEDKYFSLMGGIFNISQVLSDKCLESVIIQVVPCSDKTSQEHRTWTQDKSPPNTYRLVIESSQRKRQIWRITQKPCALKNINKFFEATTMKVCGVLWLTNKIMYLTFSKVFLDGTYSIITILPESEPTTTKSGK